LQQIMTAMQAITSGDYNRRVQGTSARDEVGAMARAVEVFRENAIAKRETEDELRTSKEKAESALLELNAAQQNLIDAERLAALGHRLFRRFLVVAKILATLCALAAAVAGVRWCALRVIGSPRFALREVRVGPTVHVSRDEILARSTVELGDPLLALDTDVIAARLAQHPWIAAARVRRELPSVLAIDVTERQAAAVAVIGGLYLVDAQGHPFKHATLEEADGRVVLTGISRIEYARLPRASQGAFREALGLLDTYQHPDSLAAARDRDNGGKRPSLSEIHIDAKDGFSLTLYDSGTEIRLGRGGLGDKLARLDEILAELGPRAVTALKVVHLEGPASDRIPIRLAPELEQSSPVETSAAASTTSSITSTRAKPRASSVRERAPSPTTPPGATSKKIDDI